MSDDRDQDDCTHSEEEDEDLEASNSSGGEDPLQIAWECLDVARKIGDDAAPDAVKAGVRADVLLRLAEVSMLNGRAGRQHRALTARRRV